MKKMLAAAAAVLAVGSFTAGTANAATDSIYKIAEDNGFTYLKFVLDETGLDEVVKDCEQELTVFAPTDEAFEALFDALGVDPATAEGQAAIAALIADGTVEDILLYHVVSGTVLSTDLEEGMVPTLLTGKSLEFTTDGTDWFVNEAKIGPADLLACNGVVHVIDAVLVPPTGDMGGDTGSGTTMAMLAAALLASGLLVTAISRRRVTA